MRILFLEGDMSRSGGTERMTAWLASKLSSRHEVSILSLRLSGGEVFFPLGGNVSHCVLPAYGGRLSIPRQIRRIHKYILDERIDCVINVDVGMGFYGILAAKGTHAKAITWEHGNYFNNWGSRLFPHMRRFAARHSHAFVVLTDKDKDNYSANISRCAKLFVIPNPAEAGTHTWDAESKTILSVGHLLENKGYHRAVEIAAKILPGHPGWEWVICGEGPERPRLEAMIREAGLESQMKLPGLTRDMEPVYSRAAMLVLSSNMEGLPMVLLEGKAHGLPLVAFDIMTGPSDIIEDGVNGFLVKPHDLEDMAGKLGMLMDDASLRSRMSRDAVIGMDKFSEEVILDKWEKVLEV